MKLKVECDNISTFINALLLQRIDTIEIFLPMLGITYTKAELSPQYRLRSVVSEPVYSKAYRRATANLRKRAVREVPPYDDALRCLVQSGGTFRNHDDIIAIVKDAVNRSPLKGDRTLFFAFDTNSLIDHVYSNFLRDVVSGMLREVGFIVAEKVYDELSYHGKYSESEAKELMSIEGFRGVEGLERSLVGQNHRIERTKRIGHMELLALQSEARIEHAPTKKENGVDHRNVASDEVILRSYRYFVAERQVDILLMTGDDTVISGARGLAGVRVCPLVRSKSIETPRTCTFELLCNLIYILAVTFLVVDIRSSGGHFGRFLGLWEGKREGDWVAERVLLVSEHPIAQSVKVDLDILEEIEGCDSES